MTTCIPAVRRDGRPLWKRLGRRMRATFHRAHTVAERFAWWRNDPLLPPAHLRLYYYRTARPARFARACTDSRTELVSRGLRPEHRVLDIGCGIGNLTIGLIGYLRGGYDGMDVHQEAISWCQQAITSRHPSFRFHRADLDSQAYNPRGGSPAGAYRFPFPDKSVDAIFLGSVYTHMLPDGFEQYVREVSRLLAPGGICVASCFLLNDETRAGVDAGRSFMTFGVEHRSGVCRLHDARTPESAVAFDEAFVRRVHERAGLRLKEVRRGGWWNGVSHDQDVLTVVSSGEAG